MPDITLQISLAALDVRHARHVLPHQLRVWGPQVTEVVLVLDTEDSASRARELKTDVEEAALELRAMLDGLDHPARVVEVDRSPAARAAVGERFGAPNVPDSDFRGRPYYQYLYGLHVCRAALVLHIDSDMMFGGGSRTWLQEAQARMAQDESVVACNPLPGPPLADGRLRGQEGYAFDHVGPHAYRFANLSSRVYFVDLPSMLRRLGSLDARRIPTLRSWLGSRRRGQVNWMGTEDRLTVAMQDAGARRLDFLGDDPGMWSLHPNDREEAFYAALPGLIDHLEAGRAMPEAQLGNYDLHASLQDAVATG